MVLFMENNKKVSTNQKSPLIFVVGPTATGKSSLAKDIAERLKAPIVNLDSLQIYKSVPIGTAMPSIQERKSWKHHLYDYVNEGVNYTAGQFRSDAIDILNQATGPLVFVGGSGFYIRAFEQGMYSVKDTPIELKQEVESLFKDNGAKFCFEKLERLDPEYCKKISENDHYRVQRALELILSENKTMQEIQQSSQKQLENTKLKNPILWLGVDLERDILKQRILKRFNIMQSAGLEDEVKSLMDKNLYAWTPMRSVGYVETIEYINGKINKEEWRDLIVKNTMYLAKRQKTWFKKEARIQWINDTDKALELCLNFVNS